MNEQLLQRKKEKGKEDRSGERIGTGVGLDWIGLDWRRARRAMELKLNGMSVGRATIGSLGGEGGGDLLVERASIRIQNGWRNERAEQQINVRSFTSGDAWLAAPPLMFDFTACIYIRRLSRLLYSRAEKRFKLQEQHTYCTVL